MSLLWAKRIAFAAALLAHFFSGGAQAQPRLVFAHYLVANQDYSGAVGGDPVADYMKEMRQAQAAGIDGFALNCGGWSREPYYIERSDRLFEAAARLHTGFKLFFSADLCCGLPAADIVQMMRRYVNNPAYANIYFRCQGRPVLSTFAGQDQAGGGTGARHWWANNVLAPLKLGDAARGAKPIHVFFVPLFFPSPAQDVELPAYADVLNAPRSSYNAWWGSVADGLFYWGLAGVPSPGGPLSTLAGSEAYATVAHAHAKVYMAPCVLQFWGMTAAARGRRYYEYSGGQGLRRQWMDIIHVTKPDWVEIPTWNDFNEATYISPIDDPNRYAGNYLFKTRTGFYKPHAGAYHLMSYYIQWYKKGEPPRITRDALYWFYRTHTKDASAPGDAPVSERYGPVADSIYLTLNLTKPARLKVTTGGRARWLRVPAGSSDVEIPFTPGNQIFELRRDAAKPLLTAQGEAIDAQIKEYNFIYTTGWAQGPKTASGRHSPLREAGSKQPTFLGPKGKAR